MWTFLLKLTVFHLPFDRHISGFYVDKNLNNFAINYCLSLRTFICFKK